MISTGLQELVFAVRKAMLENADVGRVGVFMQKAPRADELPYVLFDVTPRPKQASFEPGRDHYRYYQITAKVCAAPGGGKSAIAVAEPLRAAIYECFTQKINNVAPKERLNSYLHALGWTALTPMESGDLQPYADYIGDLERWHFGNRFDLRIARL